MYYNLENKEMIPVEKESIGLSFLYNFLIGRLFLKIINKRWLTLLYSKYLNSRFSIHKIKKFIKKNSIDMSSYEKKEYCSFNDFFMRKIKSGKRKIQDGLISVCDSKLSVYEIDDDLSLNIKGSIYTVSELTGSDVSKYNFKYALVFRLCVDDYHRYIFPDSGSVLESKYIKGVFHTVRPIALKKYKVFKENSRCVTFLDCDNLGKVCYIEVGALMVGKIVNENVTNFKKGDEKGHFEFGGSTIVLLIEDNKINKKILDNTKCDIETIVKMGNKLS